ncbi:MAG TPA: DoxX family membrane protein [Patescibacteria group bacterium]|jgi:uncharacterized membrane protein YphA (DoxX/SURF4 family)|nr:DoxX family membrane protein [Patescibacteria group bacterium]
MVSRNTQQHLAKHVSVLRIIFGAIWAIDAILKWQPSFQNGFLDHVNSAIQGQPSWLNSWFHFWVQFIGYNPHLFAILTAVIESLIALALIFGFARRVTYLLAAIFSLLIWAVAEGFGGPYTNGSTDIGAAAVYAVVFFALYGLERLAKPPRLAVDNYIIKKLPWWSIVANP